MVTLKPKIAIIALNPYIHPKQIRFTEKVDLVLSGIMLIEDNQLF